MALAQSARPPKLVVDWKTPLLTTKTTPTLQVVVNPQLLRGAKLHDSSFAALQALGAEYVRYVPWLPYPRQAVAELAEPQAGKTSWDFSHIDPTLDDFMKATEGHSVILNFSTIPAWMYKTANPVTYPDDPNQVYWNYTQGTELRDPTMKEVSQYFARLLAWYTQGGFTDEAGKRWESGHHYKIAYWEVLNEIDFEHHWTPQKYTAFYDAVTAAMLKVDPDLKFVALAMASPSSHPEMFDYFLNPANHRKGAPLDFISYHFYAIPQAEETIANWQYSFFDQADGFLNTVRYVEQIRKRLSPSTRTDLDELGVILPEDIEEINRPGYVAKKAPDAYWNLAGALYAYLYIELSGMGIDVVGESQLVGYPSQFPSVSMMDFETTRPNARFWVLKLIKDHFGPGDRVFSATLDDSSVAAQAVSTPSGHALLVVNKRDRPHAIELPAEVAGAHLSKIAPSSQEQAAEESILPTSILDMEPFEVAVVTWK